MTAQTGPRKTQGKSGAAVIPAYHDLSVKAGVKIWAGSLVMLNAGLAAPGATATGRISAGVARATVDNTGGADGAVKARVDVGVFKFVNLGADPVTIADLGADCFAVDDQTIARTNGGSTRSRAGKIMGIDSDGGVFVLVGLGL